MATEIRHPVPAWLMPGSRVRVRHQPAWKPEPLAGRVGTVCHVERFHPGRESLLAWVRFDERTVPLVSSDLEPFEPEVPRG